MDVKLMMMMMMVSLKFCYLGDTLGAGGGVQ